MPLLTTMNLSNYDIYIFNKNTQKQRDNLYCFVYDDVVDEVSNVAAVADDAFVVGNGSNKNLSKKNKWEFNSIFKVFCLYLKVAGERVFVFAKFKERSNWRIFCLILFYLCVISEKIEKKKEFYFWNVKLKAEWKNRYFIFEKKSTIYSSISLQRQMNRLSTANRDLSAKHTLTTPNIPSHYQHSKHIRSFDRIVIYRFASRL